VVYPERMRRNLDLTRGLVFSGQLLLDLAAAGMLREQAYRWYKPTLCALWEEDGDFRAHRGRSGNPRRAHTGANRRSVFAHPPTPQRGPDLRAGVRVVSSGSFIGCR